VHDVELERLVAGLVQQGRLDATTFAALLPAALDPQALAERVAHVRALLATLEPGLTPEATVAENERLPATTRYEPGAVLGRGGMGEVLLARDRLLSREVAMKTLLPEAQTGEDARVRFLHEAKATAALAHPGIVPVYDLGVLPDGRWFYAMQRVAGERLSELKPRIAESLPRLMAIFARVCQTVAYAHEHGVIHRDLKPENILVGEHGEVYVADWGLAKQMAGLTDTDETLGTAFTVPGVVMGTIDYMAPEQLQGRELTPSTDVWALGVMMFELLTLRHPFAAPGAAMNTAVRILTRDAPDPRETEGRAVPDDLAEACLDALSRRPEERPSARRLAERVVAFLERPVQGLAVPSK
jgi:serine/threonine-protein kinase